MFGRVCTYRARCRFSLLRNVMNSGVLDIVVPGEPGEATNRFRRVQFSEVELGLRTSDLFVQILNLVRCDTL